MRCPYCKTTEDKVIETRISKEGDVIRRRRQCIACGQRFTTYETVIPAELYVIKKDGTRQEFKPEKILGGIRQACWKRVISEEQIDRVFSNITSALLKEANQQSEISSARIGEVVMAQLRELDEVAYVRFASVYRHFKDAGEFIDVINDLSSQTTTEDTAKPSGE